MSLSARLHQPHKIITVGRKPFSYRRLYGMTLGAVAWMALLSAAFPHNPLTQAIRTRVNDTVGRIQMVEDQARLSAQLPPHLGQEANTRFAKANGGSMVWLKAVDLAGRGEHQRAAQEYARLAQGLMDGSLRSTGPLMRSYPDDVLAIQAWGQAIRQSALHQDWSVMHQQMKQQRQAYHILIERYPSLDLAAPIDTWMSRLDDVSLKMILTQLQQEALSSSTSPLSTSPSKTSKTIEEVIDLIRAMPLLQACLTMHHLGHGFDTQGQQMLTHLLEGKNPSELTQGWALGQLTPIELHTIVWMNQSMQPTTPPQAHPSAQQKQDFERTHQPWMAQTIEEFKHTLSPLSPSEDLALHTSLTSLHDWPQDGVAFLHQAQAQGFEASDAWSLWHERLMLGDKAHEIVLDPMESPCQELLNHARDVLAHIQTPHDWSEYLQTWPTWVQSWNQTHPKNILDDQSMMWINVLGFQANQTDRIQARLQGLNPWKPGPMSYDVLFEQAKQGQWMSTLPEVGITSKAKSSALKISLEPHHITPEVLMVWQQPLVHAMQESGLTRLTWPIDLPQTQETYLHLAQLITESNTSLQTITGWQGPVLGLQGHVSLQIVPEEPKIYDTLGMTGLTLHQGKDGARFVHMIVSTNPKTWRSLGHEWFHALDMWMSSSTQLYSNTGLASEHPWFVKDALNPWVNLYRGLEHTSLSQNQQQDDFDAWQLNSTTRAWPILAQPTAMIIQAQRTHPNWTVQQSLDVFTQQLGPKMAHDLHPLIQEVIFEHPQLNNDHTSTWMAMAAQKDKQEGTSYWGHPMEMMARSFETYAMQFSSTDLIRRKTYHDNDMTLSPDLKQSVVAKPVWQAFFSTLTPQWQSTLNPPHLHSKKRIKS